MGNKSLSLNIFNIKFMKKIIVALTFIVSILNLNAQKLSYGPILGVAFYEVNNSSSSSNFKKDDNTILNLGGYAEYNFTENSGIKTEVTFNNKNIKVLNSESKIEMSFFEIAPSFKYDFGEEYRKGFYMMLGPKFSFMTKAESSGQDVKDEFNTTNVAAQIALGQRVAKYIDVQLKFDYDLTPFMDANGRKSSFFGANLSLNLDLEKILN